MIGIGIKPVDRLGGIFKNFSSRRIARCKGVYRRPHCPPPHKYSFTMSSSNSDSGVSISTQATATTSTTGVAATGVMPDFASGSPSDRAEVKSTPNTSSNIFAGIGASTTASDTTLPANKNATVVKSFTSTRPPRANTYRYIAPAPTHEGVLHLGDRQVQAALHRASSQNMQVFFAGLATDPLSYFDAMSRGGRIICAIHRHGYDAIEKTFLTLAQTPVAGEQSMMSVGALETAIQQARTLLVQRRDFLGRYQKYCSQQRMEPSASWPFWFAQINAYQQAKMLCDFGELLTNKARQIWRQKLFFLPLQSQPKIDDPVTQLNVATVEEIGASVGMKFRSWNSHEVAKAFGLTTKEQVFALHGKVIPAILNELSRYSYNRNPAFVNCVRTLKEKKCVSPNLYENRMLYGPKWSLSSLRWLLIIYLGIPFTMKEGTPLFEPKQKEDDLPPAWRTASLKKVQQDFDSGILVPTVGSDTMASGKLSTSTLARVVSSVPASTQQPGRKTVANTKPKRQLPIKKRKKTKQSTEAAENDQRPTKKKTKKDRKEVQKTGKICSEIKLQEWSAVANPSPLLSEVVIDPLVDLPTVEDGPMKHIMAMSIGGGEATLLDI